MLFLVRHADAGDKRAWVGPDGDRPLTGTGRRQAHGLVGQLDGDPITAIVTSPTLRCVQTVGPLARHRGLAVRTDAALHVDADPDRALARLLAASPQRTVWCSHGELIGVLITRLRELGAPIDPTAEWVKGSTWRLEITDGKVLSAAYRPPAGA